MKRIILMCATSLMLLNCDVKKASISGKVVNALTGEGVYDATVSFIQCKTNGDNCDEIVIGQANTNLNGEFIIDKKTGSKSKTKWITVYKGTKKIAQKDNVGLTDKNIVIETLP
jgi:hypothetical protein